MSLDVTKHKPTPKACSDFVGVRRGCYTAGLGRADVRDQRFRTCTSLMNSAYWSALPYRHSVFIQIFFFSDSDGNPLVAIGEPTSQTKVSQSFGRILANERP